MGGTAQGDALRAQIVLDQEVDQGIDGLAGKTENDDPEPPLFPALFGRHVIVIDLFLTEGQQAFDLIADDLFQRAARGFRHDQPADARLGAGQAQDGLVGQGFDIGQKVGQGAADSREMVRGGFRQGNGPRGFQPDLKEALGRMHKADRLRPDGDAEAVAIVNRGEALYARREIHPSLLSHV